MPKQDWDQRCREIEAAVSQHSLSECSVTDTDLKEIPEHILQACKKRWLIVHHQILTGGGSAYYFNNKCSWWESDYNPYWKKFWSRRWNKRNYDNGLADPEKKKHMREKQERNRAKATQSVSRETLREQWRNSKRKHAQARKQKYKARRLNNPSTYEKKCQQYFEEDADCFYIPTDSRRIWDEPFELRRQFIPKVGCKLPFPPKWSEEMKREFKRQTKTNTVNKLKAVTPAPITEEYLAKAAERKRQNPPPGTPFPSHWTEAEKRRYYLEKDKEEKQQMKTDLRERAAAGDAAAIKEIETRKEREVLRNLNRRLTLEHKKKCIQERAQKRGLVFELTDAHLAKLLKSPCYYCAVHPTAEQVGSIDRLDSDTGYTEANTVACCKECNWSKGTLSKEHYIEACKQVYRFRVAKINGLEPSEEVSVRANAVVDAAFRQYQRRANIKGRSFTLTFEQFEQLYYGNCAYCDVKECHGVDRIVNTVGYDYDNCCSSCFTCNAMKYKFDVDEFLQRCESIYWNH